MQRFIELCVDVQSYIIISPDLADTVQNNFQRPDCSLVEYVNRVHVPSSLIRYPKQVCRSCLLSGRNISNPEVSEGSEKWGGSLADPLPSLPLSSLFSSSLFSSSGWRRVYMFDKIKRNIQSYNVTR